MSARRPLYGKIRAELLHHPKLIASAKSLALPKAYLIGHLTSMWLGALEFAEDGDLWRGTDEASLRFFESLADIPAEPERFLSVFRQDRWLDDWLIHDWLDHTSELLIARYSSHHRQRLVEMYRKHNRIYGGGLEEEIHPDGVQGKLPGTEWEAPGKQLGSEWEGAGNRSNLPLALSPKPQTLSPIAQKAKETKKPNGGMGENTAQSPPTTEPRASFSVVSSGLRAQGYPLTQAELTGEGLTHKAVFEAFLPLLVMHGILSLEAFYGRVRRCAASPAEWIMLYLDKIHAVYRSRDGTTLLDEDADPVGMTMAGLTPGRNRRRHQHTEAARTLFIEVMTDYMKALKEGKTKWAGKLSGPTIVVELERRKGKASKIA